MRKKIRRRIVLDPYRPEEVVLKKYLPIRRRIMKKLLKNKKRSGSVKCKFCGGRVKYEIAINRSMHVMCKCGVNWFEGGKE